MAREKGLQLEGKVVIVTGAAEGLGRRYAVAFSREGAKVVVCDIKDCMETVKEIEAIGGEVLALSTDVTNEKSTVEMAKQTVKRFGRIDVLVNNAGFYRGMKSKFFDQITLDEWNKMMATHPIGTFLCCKAVFPHMKEQKAGKIVNVSSGIVFNAFPGADAYAAAKGATFIFTRVLARELGQYNINVNAVAPGLVMTEASAEMMNETAAEGFRKVLALQRLQQPESPVGTVLFLASPLSDDIAGQTINVDCGHTMH